MEKTPEKTPNLSEAEQILRAGGVVAMPTETVYGLAARIDSELGLRQIFALKERPFFDPLIVHIADLSDVPRVVADWPRPAEVLAKAFWPGPLTLVLKKNPALNSLITAGLETVGLRMPDHPTALALIRAVGVPLAAPSANKFKKTSPTLAEHVRRDFPQIHVLDAGPARVGIESTVAGVEATADGCRIKIFRPGMISGSDIRTALAEEKIHAEIVFETNSAASPGTMAEHYQPAKPLVIVSAAARESALQAAPALARASLNLENPRFAWLDLGNDPRLAARFLYAELHRFGADPSVDCIVCARNPENSTPDWLAIWNRLERAASARG